VRTPGELVTALTERAFTGQALDSRTGSMYYRARWYDPRLGRFIQADTVVPEPGNPQDLNRYAYARNNPLRCADPTGHCPWCIPVAIVILKGVDYGWTAYDVWQAARVLNDPDAPRDEKLLAGLNIAVAVAFEAGEPDDELPVAVPLDDIGRRALMVRARLVLAEGGEEALRRYLREQFGEQADEVLGWVVRAAEGEGARVIERHHLLPRRFREYFEAAGLDINAPEFIVELPRDVHRLKPYGLHTGPDNWNRLWRDFFTENPNASPEEILQYLDWMMRRFGLR